MLVVGPERAGKTALLAALAPPWRCQGRHAGAAPRVPLGIDLESRVDRLAAGALGHAAGSRPSPAPDLLVVNSLQPSDVPALGNLLSAGARGVVAAGEPQAMAGVPRQSVDLLVSVGRLHGSFVVTAIEDATGAQLFLPEGRRVPATDGDAVIRRDRAQGRLRRGVFQRAALTSATGRHIPAGAENPLRHRPISGTNRFELRGILRVGTLHGERPAEGTIA